MPDSDNKPTLGRKPLGLKTAVQAGEVKQTFSHGRTNKVVVEVKRRKVLGKRHSVSSVVNHCVSEFSNHSFHHGGHREHRGKSQRGR